MIGELFDNFADVRIPAALSVPGDTVSGAAAAGAFIKKGGVRTAGLAAASTCLYLAGMAAQQGGDAFERLGAVARELAAVRPG